MSWLSGLRPWPRRIGGQIVLLVLLAALFTYVGNAIVRYNFEHRPPPDDHVFMAAGNVLFSALPVLADTSPDRRQAIVDLITLMAPALELKLEAHPNVPEGARKHDGRGPFTDFATAGGEIYSLGLSKKAGMRMDRLLGIFPDGSGVYALLPLPPQPPQGFFWSQFMVSNWLVLLIVVLPLALFWAVRGVSRPLRLFAEAAEEFSFEGHHALLPETGPEEIRVAARALNRMRDRIAGMAADRTRMLSAVGHDLRTPVTRMRLRAEFIPEADIREGQLRDLERMDKMIDDALIFLRDGQVKGERAPTDLASLLQTLSDEFGDMGSDVVYSGPDRLVCSIEPEALRRAVENLVQNGLKFGSRVRVELATVASEQATISVDDDGPGISAADREDMLKPFVTGDASRSGERGGFGLGLSIAKAVVDAHGGELRLDRSGMGGLSARIQLPCRNPEPDLERSAHPQVFC